MGSTQEVLFEEEVSIEHKKYFIGYNKEYVKIAVESRTDISNQVLKCEVVGCLKDEIYLGRLC